MLGLARNERVKQPISIRRKSRILMWLGCLFWTTAIALTPSTSRAGLIVLYADIPAAAMPNSTNIFFPQFDPVWGNLQRVYSYHSNRYLASGSSTAVGGTFVNPNWNAGWAFGGNFRFSFVAPGMSNVTQRYETRGGAFSSPNPVHVAEVSIGPTDHNSDTLFIDVTHPSFGAFLGTGLFSTSFSSAFLPDAGGSGLGVVWSGEDITEISTQISYASVSRVFIAYEYTAVPEPSGLLLLVVSIGLLYLLNKRTKRPSPDALGS